MSKKIDASSSKKQQLCAFITLLQAMGCDVVAFDGSAFKVKKNEDKH